MLEQSLRVSSRSENLGYGVQHTELSVGRHCEPVIDAATPAEPNLKRVVESSGMLACQCGAPCFQGNFMTRRSASRHDFGKAPKLFSGVMIGKVVEELHSGAFRGHASVGSVSRWEVWNIW